MGGTYTNPRTLCAEARGVGRHGLVYPQQDLGMGVDVERAGEENCPYA